MKHLARLAFAVATAAAVLAPVTEAFAVTRDAKPSARCSRHYGKGWAPTENMAKFQAREIIEQTTGNWPIATDKITNEKYSCKPEGAQWFCRSQIDVCKS